MPSINYQTLSCLYGGSSVTYPTNKEKEIVHSRWSAYSPNRIFDLRPRKLAINSLSMFVDVVTFTCGEDFFDVLPNSRHS